MMNFELVTPADVNFLFWIKIFAQRNGIHLSDLTNCQVNSDCQTIAKVIVLDPFVALNVRICYTRILDTLTITELTVLEVIQFICDFARA